MSTSQDFLHGLNEYSNLLLVVVTIVYVVVTWRTLRALKQSSLREREAHHLGDIKEQVATPLIQWLKNEAVQRLRGRFPIVGVSEIATPRMDAELGGDQFERKQTIQSTLVEPERLPAVLYSDAKSNHFPSQLSRFGEFRCNVLSFASDCAEFASRCADDIAAGTTLRRGPIQGTNIPQVADSDSLVVACIQSLMQGLRFPTMEIRTLAGGGMEVYGNILSGVTFAVGERAEVDGWLKPGIELVRGRWSSEGLSKRTEELLERATGVSNALDIITFTHSLTTDCPFIGGP